MFKIRSKTEVFQDLGNAGLGEVFGEPFDALLRCLILQ